MIPKLWPHPWTKEKVSIVEFLKEVLISVLKMTSKKHTCLFYCAEMLQKNLRVLWGMTPGIWLRLFVMSEDLMEAVMEEAT